MSALYELFHHDVDLQDWENLLAELSAESVGTIIENTEAEAWEVLRQCSIDELPHAGNVYANALLAKIEAELYDKLGTGIDLYYNANHLDTVLSLGESKISSIEDLEEHLASITGLEEFTDLIDDMDGGLDAERSVELTKLYDNGVDFVIDEYTPDDAVIALLEDGLKVDRIPYQLKRAVGAAYFIQAVVLELIPNADIQVQVCNLEVNVNFNVRNKCISIRYLDSFTPYINDQSIVL